MGLPNSLKTTRLLSIPAWLLAGVLTTGCGNDRPAGVGDLPNQGSSIDARDACSTPNAGCACEDANRVVVCGQVQRRAAGQTWCSVGHRTCGGDGLWGECEIEGLKVLSTPSDGQATQSLGTAQACDDNPCDPFCEQIVDSGSDLDLPPELQETSEGGIALVARPGSLNQTSCTGIEVVPSPQALVVDRFGATSSTNGLLGEYFDSRSDIGIPGGAVPAFTRIDPQLNFDWGTTPIAAGFPSQDVSVRWTGWLLPSVTQAYQLCVRSDDGIRVWLGDNPAPIIDKWTIHAAVLDCASAPGPVLQAGRLYKLRVEYFEAAGEAVAQLQWRHAAAVDGEVVPSANLMPPDVYRLNGDFRVTPEFAQFSVHGVPDGCFDGPIQAVWNVDRVDRASVDATGKVKLLVPVAGDITATAYVGDFSASGVVTVTADATDELQAPDGSVTALGAPATGSDPMQVLYPYANTVLPLGLRAPTIQWDNGGSPADAVKISLRSPATGPAAFVWNKILPDSSPGRYAIPQTLWASFEASSKGQSAAYSVQRVIGGTARPEVVRPISFASAPVRGKIYYTQYGRSGSTNVMVADPGSPAAASSVFATDSGGVNGRKCPVCHSVSANGSMFATADRSFSSNGGLSRIETDGSLTALADYSATVSPYRDGADDFRGFAWAPLTPNGKYALAANNFWGNTFERVVGLDASIGSVVLPGGFLSGGSGTGLLARYYSNTSFSGPDYRRTDPKLDFAWAGASPGGAVPAQFSVDWTGDVQAYTTESYTFSLKTSGGVRLQVGGAVLVDQLANASAQTFTASTALTQGQRTPIELEYVDNGGAPGPLSLSWQTATLRRELVPQTQLYPNDGWHGLLATYFDENDFTKPFITDRIESNLDADWGSGGPRPMLSGDNDNWSAIYRGQLEAPASGDLSICAASSDAVKVLVGGVTRIDAPGAFDDCSTLFAVTEGTKYDLEVRFSELTGDAALHLSWQLSGAAGFTREIVPSERLTPPAGWVAPTHGLTATYYDTADFNRSLATGATSHATRRIEENADLTWDDQRPEFSSAITSNDSFTSRLTGQLETPCAGTYEFEVAGGDGGRLWIDGVRVVELWSTGTKQGATWLEAGKHDLKLDHRADTGVANVNLRWKALCLGDTAFTPVPSANLYPTGDQGLGGYVLAGGDNGNGSGYFIWETPTAPGSPAVDVTAASAGRWGLGATAMMVPSFSPDGSKLVFIDGDSAAGNGWRKGLSTFAFDAAAQVFKERKTIVSTWPFGDTLKWPVFESDSRSVIYQATVPVDACCRNTAWQKYGYMGPTNYFEDPGRLFSVDTQAAAAVPVELANLNRGERAVDRNKSYQATMLPQAAGGYRWAVFTSTRPYGNTLNLDGQQDFSDTSAYTPISEYPKLQSMLWVAAIDDTPSGSADRSHPAFFLPNQMFSEDPNNGYLNERGYWVAEACRPPGDTVASECDVDEDCCGGGSSAVCRIDVPATVPPTRHCFKLPAPGNCSAMGDACASSDECCTGNACIDGSCAKPPAFSTYAPANFERIYASDCPPRQKVDWTFFDYKARVPAPGGAIEFFAESSDDTATFQTLPPYPAPVDLDGVVRLGVQDPPGDLSNWTRIPLQQLLSDANIVERKYLKITLRFVPNQTAVASPLLTDWRQSFSCPPAE